MVVVQESNITPAVPTGKLADAARQHIRAMSESYNDISVPTFQG